MLKLYFKVAASLNNTMLRLCIIFFIPEMKLRVLNKDYLLIKISITDGRRFILHYIGTLCFFMAAILETILKTIQNGG